MIGLPHIGTACGEAEGSETHGLQGDVAGQDHEVGPGNGATVLLFDGPEQTPRLLEVRVIRPTVEGSEALLAATAPATTVACAIGAGAVPRHANEERAVMAEVRGPPVLRIRHQRRDVFLQ